MRAIEVKVERAGVDFITDTDDVVDSPIPTVLAMRNMIVMFDLTRLMELKDEINDVQA